MTTPFGRITANKISISATDQSADINPTRIEHLSLLTTTIGSKEIAIGSAQLGNKLILESNQSSTSIDKQGQGDQDFPSSSPKSGNTMSVDFGRNSYKKIGMNS